jgi:hypothetical protein
MRTLVTGRARSANGRFRALRKARSAVTLAAGQEAWNEATGKVLHDALQGATSAKSGPGRPGRWC